MRVSIIDYTPKGKPLDKCTPRQLLVTLEAVYSDGMLRMHATDRLHNEILAELESRKLGLFKYEDDPKFPKEKGFRWSIGELKQELDIKDKHYALSAKGKDEEVYVFACDGPLTSYIENIQKKLGKEPPPNKPYLLESTICTGMFVSPFICSG